MSELSSLNAAVGSDSAPARGIDERECNDDGKAHLATCRVSQLSLIWKDLILAQVGLFSLSECKLKICQYVQSTDILCGGFGDH